MYLSYNSFGGNAMERFSFGVEFEPFRSRTSFEHDLSMNNRNSTSIKARYSVVSLSLALATHSLEWGYFSTTSW